MRQTHCRTWHMARKLKKVKNETQTWYMTWNRARNTEKREK